MRFIKRSVDHPEYALYRRDDGRLEIWLDDGADPLIMVRDDGLHLEADFEAHCDDLAEEMRILLADARRDIA